VYFQVFGDAKTTSAVVGRPTQQRKIMETGKESWRVKNRA